MGISKDESTLHFGQQSCPLKEVFTNYRRVNSRLGVRISSLCVFLTGSWALPQDRWTWKHDRVKLHWDARNEAEISVWLCLVTSHATTDGDF